MQNRIMMIHVLIYHHLNKKMKIEPQFAYVAIFVQHVAPYEKPTHKMMPCLLNLCLKTKS